MKTYHRYIAFLTFLLFFAFNRSRGQDQIITSFGSFNPAEEYAIDISRADAQANILFKDQNVFWVQTSNEHDRDWIKYFAK